MKNWFITLHGAITLSVIALLMELSRAFLDNLVTYPQELGYAKFVQNAGNVLFVSLLYTVLFGGWAWALLRGSNGSRRVLVVAFIINIVFLLVIPVGTLVAYCPTPCSVAWPLMELSNWLNVIFGLLAAVALVLQFRPAKEVG